MARIRRLTGGRAWVARLSGLFVMAAIVALIVAVLPVQAGAGDKTSGENVFPYEIDLGGQPGDCGATVTTFLDYNGSILAYPGLKSLAANSFRIVNLSAGVPVGGGWFQHTDSAGAGMVIEVNPAQGDKLFDFRVVSGGSIADVIVNGGSDSTHFVYSRDLGVGHVSADQALHAPNKGRGGLTNYFSTSHAEFCYDTFAAISGTVWHDNDQDGTQDNPPGTLPENIDLDEPEELGLEGWTVRVYDSSGTQVASTDPDGTATDGSYSFSNLPIGENYTVCQEDPGGGDWAQNDVGGTWDPDECGSGSEEDGGHFIALQGDATADFGNFMTEFGGCGSTFGTGDHAVTFPSSALLCFKPPNLEWVVETYLRANGDEVHDFHPVVPFLPPVPFADVTEVHVFSLDLEKEQETGRTLAYDDGDGEAEALLCKVDPRELDVNGDPIVPNELDPAKVGSVALEQSGGPSGGPHTTCIITFTKNSDDSTTFLLYSRIDGRRIY